MYSYADNLMFYFNIFTHLVGLYTFLATWALFFMPVNAIGKNEGD